MCPIQKSLSLDVPTLFGSGLIGDGVANGGIGLPMMCGTSGESLVSWNMSGSILMLDMSVSSMNSISGRDSSVRLMISNVPSDEDTWLLSDTWLPRDTSERLSSASMVRTKCLLSSTRSDFGVDEADSDFD